MAYGWASRRRRTADALPSDSAGHGDWAQWRQPHNPQPATMTSMLSQLSPSVTNMIRLDHMHVLTAFHQYETGSSARKKKGLADNICLAIEIHAQLEEEVFYPALRVVADNEMLRKSTPEHDEMRGLIARLRNMPVNEPAFDDTFFELMRHVLHHVADEETHLLPAAERLLPDQLGELGARMTKRRLELTAPRTPELASSLARSMSTGTIVAAGSAVLAGAYLLTRTHNAGKLWQQRGLRPVR